MQEKIKTFPNVKVDNIRINVNELQLKNTEQVYLYRGLPLDILYLNDGILCFWFKLEDVKKIERQMNRELKEIGIWFNRSNQQAIKSFMGQW